MTFEIINLFQTKKRIQTKKIIKFIRRKIKPFVIFHPPDVRNLKYYWFITSYIGLLFSKKKIMIPHFQNICRAKIFFLVALYWQWFKKKIVCIVVDLNLHDTKETLKSWCTFNLLSSIHKCAIVFLRLSTFIVFFFLRFRKYSGKSVCNNIYFIIIVL